MTPHHSGRLLAVDHVNIEAPEGLDAGLRWFYGELIGLHAVDEADESAAGSVLRFRSERIELRIHFVSNPKVELLDHRVHVEVRSVDAAAADLTERGYTFDWITGLQSTDRAISVLDPAGNRVLLRKLSGGHLF